MTDGVLLRARGVEKIYQTGDSELRVLKGLNLDVYAGEALCIVGESGSGKSTLLHILGTLDRPTSGTVIFKNENLFTKKDHELALFRNQSLGFVFQFHHLLGEFTALENVIMPARIGGLSSKQSRRRAEDLFALLGVSHRKNHFPSQMSGGEQQRVAIARALMQQPKLLLADEPTGNLDTENTNKIKELLFALRQQLGITLVVVTHDQSLARSFPKVMRLRDGAWEA